MAELHTYTPPTPLTGLERLPLLQGGDAKGLSLAGLAAVPRGQVLLDRVPYTADVASTSDSDPGAGKVRWNNATQASATVVFVDDVDAIAGDHSALWATVDALGYLYLALEDLSIWQKFQVSGVTDASGYAKFTVTFLDGVGSFAADDSVELMLQQPDPEPSTGGATAPVVSESSTGLTATAANAGNYTRFTNASAKTYTFDDSETYTTNKEYHGRNVGAADLTLTAAGGMTLNPPAGGTLVIPQGGTFTIKIVASDEADVFGVTVAP